MIIVGIDTDAKGSIALLILTDSARPVLDVYPIPNRIKALKNGTNRLEVDYPALVAIMLELTSRVCVDRFYLEDQWSRPNQDSGATFTFGKTFGDCRSATAAGILSSGAEPTEVEKRIRFIPGADWKSEMRLDRDKNKSLKLATQLFPACAHAWKKKSLHTSAAEASLLALWGATQEGLRLSPGVVVNAPKTPILTTASSLVC